MRKIEFKAGYHEWLLFVGGKIVFATSPTFLYEPYEKEDIYSEVYDLFNSIEDIAWREDYEDCEGVDFDLFESMSKQEKERAQRIMIREWKGCYL